MYPVAVRAPLPTPPFFSSTTDRLDETRNMGIRLLTCLGMSLAVDQLNAHKYLEVRSFPEHIAMAVVFKLYAQN